VSNRPLLLLLALLGIAGLPLTVSACAHDDEEKDGESGFEAWLIEKNRKISETIDEAAEAIDVYVANAKLVDDPNRSQITLHNAFQLSEGGERVYSPHVGARLHLPNLQEKVQLRISSYDEDAEERGINENRYRRSSAERTYGTSLSLIRELGNVRTEFRPRVEYTDEVLTSYLFKFTSEAERGAFSIDPELQLFARSNDGTGQFVALNFGFQLSTKDELEVINEEQYTDGDNTMSTNHGLRWQHDYDRTYSFVNSVIVESNNRDTYHLDQTIVSSSFRHKLRRNILHYSVTPFATFAKAEHFHPRAALDLKVEIIF
jgi:hypothetical protein